MAEYFTLSDNGTPEQHTGDVSDAPVDYKKMMLDYGWIPPVAYGAYKLAEPLVEKGRDYLKSRKLGKQEKGPMAFGDEGIIDVSSRDVTEKEPVPKGWEEIVAKSEANAASKAAEAAAKANPIPTGMTPGIPTGQPNVSVNLAGAFTQPSGYSVAPPAPVLQPGQFDPARIGQPLQDPLAGRGYQTPVQDMGPRPGVGEAVATGGNVDQAIKQTVANQLDATPVTPKPVAPVPPSAAVKVEGLVRDAQGNFQYPPGMSPAAIEGHKAFNQQYPEHARALEAEGKFGIVGGGAADNSLRNSYGSKLRKQILNEVNQGQLGGINTNYLENINPAIKALSTESGLGKTLAELKANNPKGGIHGPLGTPATIGKLGELVSKPGVVSGLVNKGSIPFLLMAMADAAKAAQQGKYAEAAAQGLDIGTDYIPGVSQFKQGMSPNVANSPIVPPQQISNAALLGSPYAQTEWAKAQRQRNKAGAGQGQRGVPPPNQR